MRMNDLQLEKLALPTQHRMDDRHSSYSSGVDWRERVNMGLINVRLPESRLKCVLMLCCMSE